MNEKKRILRELFLSFFKIGLFTFGGGYAMIPLIEKEVLERKQWIKKDEILDILAASQSIPGVIAINSATFIGYKKAGKRGAIAATVGVIMPSFLIILLIAIFFSRVNNNALVMAAFRGIRPVVVALIITAALKVGKVSIRDKSSFSLMLLSIILVVILDVHIIFAILIGAFWGVLSFVFWPRKVRQVIRRKVRDTNGVS